MQGGESVQHGCAPVRRYDKSGLCTMDEPSILRRRGLQVGKQIKLCLHVLLCLLGLFPWICMLFVRLLHWLLF